MQLNGKALKVSVFGQSHAPAVGAVAEGFPAGFAVDQEALRAFLRRRAPGQGPWATQRREADEPEFVSGLVEGHTCGAPLCALIRNADTRSGDYAALRDVPRPSHADWPAMVRYGADNHDIRGGGMFSARLTAPICVMGGIALQMLAERGVYVGAHIAAIAGVEDARFDPVSLTREKLQRPAQCAFPVLDEAAGERMRAEIEQARQEADSVGGIVECAAIGMPVGIGGPLFDGLESDLSAALFGIPAVKGVSFGSGFDAAGMRGSAHNDPYGVAGGAVRPRTNNAGGIVGGMTTGMPILLRAAFKPTPSIGQPQRSVSLSRMEETELVIRGRHDPCVVPRAVPVVEAVTALVLLDRLLADNPT